MTRWLEVYRRSLAQPCRARRRAPPRRLGARRRATDSTVRFAVDLRDAGAVRVVGRHLGPPHARVDLRDAGTEPQARDARRPGGHQCPLAGVVDSPRRVVRDDPRRGDRPRLTQEPAGSGKVRAVRCGLPAVCRAPPAPSLRPPGGAGALLDLGGREPESLRCRERDAGPRHRPEPLRRSALVDGRGRLARRNTPALRGQRLLPGRPRRGRASPRSLAPAVHRRHRGGGRTASPLTQHLAEGQVGLWEGDGRPVSMAYASPANGGVTRICGVWTPAGVARARLRERGRRSAQHRAP